MYIILGFIGLCIGNMLYDILIRRNFFVSKKKIQGQIDIDHETFLSHIQTYNNTRLLDKSTKYILFKVNHDAKISREEQSL